MGRLTDTASGAIASFKSPGIAPVQHMKINFTPKQDLHGYSKPWPAGCGKNLFDGNYVTGIIQVDGENNYNWMINTQGKSAIISCSPNTTYTIKKHSSSNRFAIGETDHYPAHSDILSGFVNDASLNQYTVTTSANAQYLIVYVSTSTEQATPDMMIELGSSASSYEPYSNVCPIEGWTGLDGWKSGKNLAHIIGYSASTMADLSSNRTSSNKYGTTINTTDFSLPDTPLVINQSLWPGDTISEYRNGYVIVAVDSLIFNDYYDISFKITNITNNPLNATLQDIRLLTPRGTTTAPTQIIDNIVVFKNKQFVYSTTYPSRSTWEIHICGMSCTISEFMVTPANTSDGVFEPYCGVKYPVTFPVLGKNLFDAESIPFVDGYWKWNGVNSGAVTSTSYSRTKYFIDVSLYAGLTITLNKRPGGINPSIVFADSNGFIDGIKNNGAEANTSWTFQIPSNAVSMGISVPHDAVEIQLELGDTATTYEPYNPDNTVYGGYVDVAAGEVVATHKKISLTGNETVKTYSDTIYYIDDVATDVDSNTKETSICTHGLYGGYASSSECRFSITNTGRLYIRQHFTDVFKTTTEFSTYLSTETQSGRPMTIIYPIATPVHYPITPTQITALLNQNNFWSNAASVDVEYELMECNYFNTFRNYLINNEPHIATASGNIASFNTDMKAPLKSLKCEFSPVQDTHGYGKAWIGNAGRNMFQVTAQSDTTGEVAYTVNADGSVKAVGTPSVSTSFNLGTITLPEGTYKLQGGISNTAYINISGKVNSADNIVTFTIDAGGETITPRIYLTGGYQVDGTFYPMIKANSDNDTSWEPYENICPISGWTGLTTYNDPMYGGFINWNQLVEDGTFTTSNKWLANTDYGTIALQNNVITWTCTGVPQYYYQTGFRTVNNIASIPYDHKVLLKATVRSSIDDASVRLYGLHNNNTHLYCKTFIVEANKWTTISGILSGERDPNNVIMKAKICFTNIENKVVVGSTLEAKNFMMFDLTQMFGAGNEPETVAEFEALFPAEYYETNTGTITTVSAVNNSVYQTIPISWQSTAGTIYGGYVDLIKGELVATHATLTIDGTETMISYKTWWGGMIAFPKSPVITSATACSILPCVNTLPPLDAQRVNKCYAAKRDSTQTEVGLGLTDICSDAEAFKTYAANLYANGTPIQVCGPLETPIVTQLTPQQLKSLAGTNNIWSNANGNISLQYWRH